jgi:hypothetical protein
MGCSRKSPGAILESMSEGADKSRKNYRTVCME